MSTGRQQPQTRGKATYVVAERAPVDEVRLNALAEMDGMPGSGVDGDAPDLSACISPDTSAAILIGAADIDDLAGFVTERPALSLVVLEPDPREAERTAHAVEGQLAARRVIVLAGPNYQPPVGTRFPDLSRAPVIANPVLEQTHPREVARARGVAGRLALDAYTSTNSSTLTRSLRLARAIAAPNGGVSPWAPTFLNDVQVLSLDAFDTLLLRSVAQPADVFLKVARRALEQGLLDADITPSRFQCLRRSAEGLARQAKRTTAGTTEVTLAEIYDAWPGGRVDAHRLARLELDVEAELLYAHPSVLALLEEAKTRNIRTALVSDTYFSREELAGLLLAAGVPLRLFDIILTSADAGCSKREGALFERLLAQVPGVPPAAVCHIGDHAHADVHQAKRAGLSARLHATGLTGPVAEAIRLEQLRYGDTLPELQALRALAADGPADAETAWFFAMGASVFGPALATFADWIVTEALRDDIRTIRPIMREGGVFSDLIAASAAAHGADLDVKPFYASRSATWLAGLDTFDRAAIRRLLQRQHLTVRETLDGLGLTGHPAASALQPYLSHTLGSLPGLRAADGTPLIDVVTGCLESEPAQAVITGTMQEARALVSAYLNTSCRGARDVAFVDLGFHCSIGRALDRTQRADSPRRHHHFLLFAAESVARLWAEGADVRVFGAGPVADADLAGPIARHPALFESVLIQGGTTLGYRRADGEVVPVVDESRLPHDMQAAAAACRAGIKRFQACWLQWARQRPALARQVTSNRRGLVAPLHRLLTMPTTEEATRFGAFVHEDNDGGRSTRVLADRATRPADTDPERFLRAASSAAVPFDRATLWPAGACEQRWPGFIERRWRDAAGTPDGTPPVMPALASRMKQDGVRECLVWGAGEAGIALVRAVRREGLSVLLVTDSNPAYWGTDVDGIPVVAPAEAYRRGNHTFAIGSCAFAGEIERALQQHYATAPERARIFSPLAEVTA